MQIYSKYNRERQHVYCLCLSVISEWAWHITEDRDN